MIMKQKYSEEDLISLLKERRESAFEYLYEHYSGAIYGVILPIVRSEAEAGDLLQEVFVKIWRQIHSYDHQKGRLFTWMLNIARNLSIDFIRSKNFKDNQKNREITDTVYNLKIEDVAKEDHIGLRHLVGQLKEEYSVLIEYAYFQGFTQDEISKELSLPLGTVKTRLRAALLQLRQLMKFLIVFAFWI